MNNLSKEVNADKLDEKLQVAEHETQNIVCG